MRHKGQFSVYIPRLRFLSLYSVTKPHRKYFFWFYTVLKRLCDKGIFQNNKGTVTSLISKQEFYSVQSEKFVAETFSGSLPAFLTAFTARKNLTPEEVAHLKKMVAEYEEE